VWNDDDLAPLTGFPAHSHRDVEIVTYVREGHVSYKDSAGGAGQIDAGGVQVLSAGTGIEHAEVSAPGQRTKVFQIWLLPRERGGMPRCETKLFPKAALAGRLVALASGFKEDRDALPIRADARILAATLAAGDTVTYALRNGHKAYLVPTNGPISVNGTIVEARSGVAVRDETVVEICAIADTEIVLADVL
jgi:redox-sensitive bicupin YhaK (pirin superfamily)